MPDTLLVFEGGCRVGGRPTRAAAGVAADPHSVVSVTMLDQGSGAQRLWTTAAPHGLSNGASVTAAGTTGGLYDGNVDVDIVLSPTTWFEAAPYLGDSFGGTWS